MTKKDTASEAELLSAMTMEFCADSIEWCPFLPFSQFLVCGTYQLNKDSTDNDEQSRQGNIALLKFSSSTNSQLNNFELVTRNVVCTSGILDLKWCPNLINDKAVLAAVCSDGKLILYSLKEDKDVVSLLPLESINSSELKRILLSLDWSCENQQSHKIITSDSLGNLSYFAIREANLCLIETWKAHDFESWIASFDYDQSHIVYSGGDDCCLKCWDLRNSQAPVFVNKRFTMGVTAISKSKKNANILVTGSYDENVYLWDTRQLRSPISELSLGGGIWRLKWHPENPEYLLSASMHNGFHVLSLKDNLLELKLHYGKHNSLAYGVDWSCMSEFNKSSSSLNNLKNVIASCSFYDKLLNVWGIDF